MRLDRKLKKEIEKRAGKLVKKAETALTDEVVEAFKRRGSQLRNVVNVADSAECPEVVMNFVRYQIGRHEWWRTGDFGEKVNSDISSLEAESKAIVSDTNLISAVWMELVRLYLGYLNRHFVYMRK